MPIKKEILLLAGTIDATTGILTPSGSFCEIATQKEINIDFLAERGYTVLTFDCGEFILFPIDKLPNGTTEGDKIEFSVRRVTYEEKSD